MSREWTLIYFSFIDSFPILMMVHHKKTAKSFGYSGEMRIFAAQALRNCSRSATDASIIALAYSQLCTRRNSKTGNMERAQIIDNIRQVAARVLPKGSSLYLYGSRARGDNHDDSDWDLLLLLSDEGDSDTAFRQYAYPIISQGYDIWQSFSVHTYSKDEWYNGPHPMFYYNVEHDKQLIYES